mgnify:CR=1 FL=1
MSYTYCLMFDDFFSLINRKLTNLIKDKDMEVEALKSKNSSLLSILQTQSGAGTNVGSDSTAGVNTTGQSNEVIGENCSIDSEHKLHTLRCF